MLAICEEEGGGEEEGEVSNEWMEGMKNCDRHTYRTYLVGLHNKNIVTSFG